MCLGVAITLKTGSSLLQQAVVFIISVVYDPTDVLSWIQVIEKLIRLSKELLVLSFYAKNVAFIVYLTRWIQLSISL